LKREMNNGKEEKTYESWTDSSRARKTNKARERESWREKMGENLAYRSKYRQECET